MMYQTNIVTKFITAIKIQAYGTKFHSVFNITNRW